VASPIAPPPPIRELQLATLVDAAPAGEEWLHEQKFDGYRILAELDRGTVRLLSRRFKDWTEAFPTVAAAVARLPVAHAVLDGEVAALLPDGRTSFQALQNARTGAGADIAYFVFDLLALDHDDLTQLPLEDRKARLEQLVAPPGGPGRPGVIRYSDHVLGDGPAFFALACQRGLEGIVSKRRDKPYVPGRGTTWLKTKCLLRQELVIGGFTDPEGARRGIGALLVGVYDRERLVYAGKVGTGYTSRMLLELRARLDQLERPASPFSPEPPRAWTGGGRHWVAPELVAEVAFSEWTDDGRLRHPSFQGLRLDKPAREVVRESPARISPPPERGAAASPAPRPRAAARKRKAR
jgi:bifunctional non-homologous end joining protein LigD